MPLAAALVCSFLPDEGCQTGSLRSVLADLFVAMDPDNHVIGFGDNFQHAELLSNRQISLRLRGFLGACLPSMSVSLSLLPRMNVSALLHILIVA